MKTERGKKKTKRVSDAAALKSAADTVIAHNDALISHVKRGVAMFTDTPPVSELLKCETNGAHKYIEDLATALKVLPRGSPGVKRVMKRLRKSCGELLRALKEAEAPLPDSVPEADRRAFLDNIELVETEEAHFYNLVTGESGVSPDCIQSDYSSRICDSVKNIKKQFTLLNIAIQHIERDLRTKASAAESNAAGFLKGDRSMLRQIQRATVFGEVPSAAEVAGDVRRQQVVYGASFYRERTKYDEGFSSYKAAEMAICAPQFNGVQGAYSLAEKAALAKAIIREYRHPKDDFGT